MESDSAVLTLVGSSFHHWDAKTENSPDLAEQALFALSNGGTSRLMQMSEVLSLCVTADLGSVSQSRFSENSESVNPEMRETEFSVSQREVTQTRERGVTLACFTERGNLSSRSVTMVTYSMNLTWSGPGFSQQTLSFSLSPPSFSHTRYLTSSFIQSAAGEFWLSIVLPSVFWENHCKNQSVGLH